MSLSVDASSPSAAIGSGATTVTGAFTPPGACLLVAFCQGDANNGSLDEDQTVVDSNSNTWTKKVLANANGGAVATVHYLRVTGSSPGSITVTLTDNKGSVAKRIYTRVFVDAATGIAPDIGATNVSTSASVSVTTTVNNSWVWSTGLTANATLTAGTGCTLNDEFGGFDSGDAVFTQSQTALTATAGTSVTNTISGTATVPHNIAVEIIPGTAATFDYAGPWTRPTPGRIGPTGQWTPQPFPTTTAQTYTANLAGSLTPAGGLAKAPAVAKAGTLTSSGAIGKQARKNPAGTLTTAGTLAKQDAKALAGTLTSTGAAAKQDQKPVGGALTDHGTVAKQATKALTGAFTPIGALATIKVVLRSFAGTLTSSGSVTRLAGKGVTGTLTPTGALAKAATKALSGGLAAAGSLAKLIGRHLAGALTAAGALHTQHLGEAARATSTPAVTDRRTSTSTVADRRTSTAAVADRRTSTPEVEG